MTDTAAEKHPHRRTITISTITSTLSILVVILPLFGVVGYPWFQGFLSKAVAGEVGEQVNQQVAPVNAAMRVLLESQIVVLEDEISSLEYRRDRNPTTWTEVDARELLIKQRRLQSQRSALMAMDQASRPRKP